LRLIKKINIIQEQKSGVKMKFKVTDQEQLGLLKGSIFEFVEENSIARFLVQLIKQLDKRSILGKYSKQGGKAIHPDALIGLLFLGYIKGITHSRDLEEMSKKHIEFIYVSEGLKPDHSSICRFKRNNEKEISDLFVQLVKLSKEQGIGDYKAIAMDGTKIQAGCSKRQSYRENGLEKLEEKVKADIEDYLKRLAETDEAEKKDLNEKIAEAEKKREKIRQLKEELIERKKKLQPKDRANHQINTVEPEALMMIQAGETGKPSYNAQIAVDTKSGIIVSNYVTQERNDEKQFFRQKENIDKNIGKDENRIYQADSGYFSFEAVKRVDKEKVNAYIADPRKKWHKERDYGDGADITKKDFKYNKEKDYYECPNGKKLTRVTIQNKDNKSKTITYKTRECEGCQYLAQCNKTKGGKNQNRKILRDDREDYADKMYEKVSSEEGKKQMKTRSSSVEPVFGNIKANLGFRRFTRRGLASVQCEFNLVCIAHNLLKMYKIFVFFGARAINLMFFAIIYCLRKIYRLIDEFSKVDSRNRKILFC
jgi:transposase